MFRQDRTNPSTAVSTWKARKDLPRANPSTAVSAWMNGGLAGGPFVASGGDSIVTYGSYKAHIFLSSGNFVIESGTAPILETYIVAGGGSGGYYTGPGGGGGGFLNNSLVAAGTGVGSYAVTVGAGGAGQTATISNGNAGSDSSIAFPSTLTAVGGGAADSSGPTGSLADGGSGAGQIANSGAPYSPGSGTPGQGNPGGAGESTGWPFGSVSGAGGGGGSGGAGGDGTGSYIVPIPGNAKGGVGGAATGSNVLDGATTEYFSGGGGGSSALNYYGPYYQTATPYPVGGTNAVDGLYWNTSNVAVPGGAAGTANRGGGGASRGNPYDKAAPYGSGGSGIVVIRYLVA